MARKLNHKSRRLLAPKTRFGKNISFSQRHTPRTFKPNLQTITVWIDGKPIRVKLSARQIRSLGKEEQPKRMMSELRKLAK
ncbi:MAG: 50S ribosomal protein L28 [Anaerolineales bacterium]